MCPTARVQTSMLRYICVLLLSFPLATDCQGLFPSLADLAKLKPITSSSTCGTPASRFCSAIGSNSIAQCQEETCEFACCSTCGSRTPVYKDLGVGGRFGVTDGPPRNGSVKPSLDFGPNSRIIPQMLPSVNYAATGFTISVWIKQDPNNNGTIFSKTSSKDSSSVFVLIIGSYTVRLRYRTVSPNALLDQEAVIDPDESQRQHLGANEWHLITVSAVNKDMSYYIDSKLIDSRTLTGTVDYEHGGIVRVGQHTASTFQYKGLMQDLQMYERALTNREVIEAFTGTLPKTYIADQCRCPPTHPQIKADEPAQCIKNGNIGSDTKLRLKETSHPVEYATDGDALTFWLSQITENVTLDIKLLHTGFQVLYISMAFYGPQPAGIKIERSVDNAMRFEPWQYFAEDCVTAFGLDNNGGLPEPDSVNCIQYEQLEKNLAKVTFQPEKSPPAGSSQPARPFGPNCNHLYCSDKLLAFLQATHVRIRFDGHTLVQNQLHKYFGLYKLVVAGWCECYGHASKYSLVSGNATQLGRCICDCDPSTFTEGEQCDRCQPLYNNKPFRHGDKSDAYACAKCECNNHADSCYYNQTLDPSPGTRDAGGGGVCVGCKHNTTGRHCETCSATFYRENGKDPKAADVCKPCACAGAGVRPGMDDCAKVGGQCSCKQNTEGRTCDTCEAGFFNLSAAHLTGCVPCACSSGGSSNGDVTCHATTGQCNCKARVTGVKCDTCVAGFYGLSAHDPAGCSDCNCDPQGTQPGSTCDRVTGQCVCKPGSTGRTCGTCDEGFHSPSQDGCQACNCSASGTLPGSVNRCDKSNGKCSCKSNVEGARCDTCKAGFYNLSAADPQGCTRCSCEPKGVVGDSGQCDLLSGNCTCKRLVIGQRCDQCRPGTWNLSSGSEDGCQPCGCFPKGTVDGDKMRPDELTCSNNNGQCPCLPNIEGAAKRCDACVADYFWNPAGQGCVPCNCDVTGSLGRSCNDTGQCTCKAHVAGLKCDTCSPGYYGFTTGRCIACGCNMTGSLSSACDASGQCECKKNVQGLKCDACKPNTINLQQNNTFGCSGAPSEQPAPSVQILTSRSAAITWSPPDNPNGIIVRYELFRNTTRIYSGTQREFNDTGLRPNTVHFFYIVTYTELGSTRSLNDNKFYRTPEDLPDEIAPPAITAVRSRTANASWSAPNITNGRIRVYRLLSVNYRSPAEVEHCSGLKLGCALEDLAPFTAYNFTLEVCTNGGCGRSRPTLVNTKPTRPDSQPPPTVTSLPGGQSVQVTWDDPDKPNGRIFRYELYMRGEPFVGEGRQIYVSSPAHDPDPSRFRNATVAGLTPFTWYEFRVRTYTADVSGDTASNWTRHRSGEGSPTGAQAISPTSAELNSSAVLLTWSAPVTPNGLIARYEVYRYDPPSYAVPVKVVTVGENQTAVGGLRPYTAYRFTVRACNSFACTGHSGFTETRTRASAPAGQGYPVVTKVGFPEVHLNWSQPQTPNGPLPPSYNLSRAWSAFHAPQPRYTAGVHFPGVGYYKFPAGFVPAGSENKIQFDFRTQHEAGLLLFLVSDGSQTDMLAVELRLGKPWLVFDCQDGPAAFTIGESVRLDDGAWHRLEITRTGSRGTLTVDGQFSASGSSVGGSTVITHNTGVYIGGLPTNFKLRSDSGDAELHRIHFVGCMRNVKSQGAALAWDSALEASRVEPPINACPASVERSSVFLRGGGYAALKKGVFNGGELFNLVFSFRTQLSDGTILFAYGPLTKFAVILYDNSIVIEFSTPRDRRVLTSAADAGKLCDGEWHLVEITAFRAETVVVVDRKTDSHGALNLGAVSSELFLGGVPKDSEAERAFRDLGLDPEAAFGGCIANVSGTTNLARDVTDMWNADLDGCPPLAGGLAPCLAFSSAVVSTGNTEQFNDTTVEPFTDYLYRVESYQQGTEGSAPSAWVAVRSGQGAPSGQVAPRVTALDRGKAVNVSWSAPDKPNGVLTKYRVLASLNGSSDSVSEATVDASSALRATLDGLTPFTVYDVRIEAFTVGGSALGEAATIKTEESVPEGVPEPSVTRLPRSLVLTWSAPSQPNGVILRNNVTLDGRTVYSGPARNFTVTNLEVYTEYRLQLSACTRVGCAEGPEISVFTGELPPEGLDAPRLQVRGTSRIEVSWAKPRVLNGKISRYEVLVAVRDVVSDYTSQYNATADVFQTVLGNLTAGTLYFVRIRAFTAGGGTYSNASAVKTIEDIPDDIPAPLILATNKSALFVIILAPLKPNGVITRYELYQDGDLRTPVVNSSQRSNYTATGFTPYSKHSFQVRACTVKGCSFGEVGEGYTAEDQPRGVVRLNVTIVNASAVRAYWSRVAVPNGRLVYQLMIRGRLLVRGSGEMRTEVRTEVAISSLDAERFLVYDGLLPFTNYTMWVNASNSVGFIISNNVSETTPQAAPDGLKAPGATVLNSTAVHVNWSEPALPNGILLGYQLHERTNGIQRIVTNGARFSRHVTGLKPFTLYEYRVSARTSGGTGYSEWARATTEEDIPGPIDAPRIQSADSTAILLEWDPPSPPNGRLLRYVIYQNNSVAAQVSGNDSRYHVTGLQPFSVYVFHVGACTSKGCTNSSASPPVRTLESTPLDLAAPNLTSSAPREVVVTWDIPQVTNGIIVSYQIQRALVVSGNISGFPSNVSAVPAAAARVFSDTSVRPYTTYAYRVVAFTVAGGTPSPFRTIRTGEGDPEGIAAPTVRALGPRSLYVEWLPPTTPNGIVVRYVVHIVEAAQNVSINRVSDLNVTVTGLEPYVLYSVVVSSCTVGGCGRSVPARVRTEPAPPSGQPAPTGRAQGATAILVMWESSSQANGPIQFYVLYRRTVDEPVADNFPGPTEFVEISKIFNKREHVDTGLGIFSLQQYKVMVVTTEGNITSNASQPLRSGPAPPLAGPDVNASAANHTSVLLMWSPPDVKLLRGAAQSYRVDVQEGSPGKPVSIYAVVPGNQTHIVVTRLKPSTDYNFEVTVFNGNGSFKSSPVRERTKDGVPEGFAAPELYVKSSTEIRVSWKAPTTPNGQIVVYKVYANGTHGANSTGDQVFLTDLLPYSTYEISVEVCTVYACTRSASRTATTLQDVPSSLDPPQLTAGPTYMIAEWDPPRRPNGIISGYQLFRRTAYPCPTSPPPAVLCSYVECALSQNLCGGQCYDPGHSVCCVDVLHGRDAAKRCCGTAYAIKNQLSDVCCGERFHTQQPEHQCCNGAYVRVPPGSVCCQTAQGGHVVGLGDSCCGGTPYYQNGSKVCVCSTLHDPRPPRKCCAGRVISAAQTCCRDAGYDADPSKRCCGNEYVARDTTLCCEGANGDVRVYNYSSPREKSAANHTCCGTTRIAASLQCCNNRGYNASYQTCADRSSVDQTGCGTGVVCNHSSDASARCNRCDFDSGARFCGSVPGYYTPTPTTPIPRVCTSEFVEVLGDQFNPRLKWFNDTGLTPHTSYQYYLVAINKIGNVSSNVTENRTLMASPEGLDPPVASIISASAVLIRWRAPQKSNGVLKEYKLYRKTGANPSGTLVYAGLNVSFTDTGLQPNTGYTYLLEACTTHCTAAEMNAPVFTAQAAPDDVIPPHLRPVNATAIEITWSEPGKPNGRIISYNISLVINSSLSLVLNPGSSGLGMSHVISGLKPYTNYTFQLVACTREGCTASPLASAHTLPAAPEGVHPPDLLPLGARRVEASWGEPEVPNGVILYYELYRGGELVYNSTDRSFTDAGLAPDTTYNYTLAAATGGGVTRSPAATVTTPESSPEGIPKPTLTPRSSSEIFAEWTTPNQTNGVIRNYSVRVNGAERFVGLQLSYVITGLQPYTWYAVRVRACTDKGCGLGDEARARTAEAPPTGQGAPTLVAREWNVVEVSWGAPSAPNGVIQTYAVYRRSGNGAPIQVCRTATRSCLSTGLNGHTTYSYKIRAINGAGHGEGPWSDVHTPEGPPRGLDRPAVQILSATQARVSWQPAGEPNGIVTGYEVNAREELQIDQNITTLARVPSGVLNATVSGLKPNTDYEFRVAAVNSRATGYSGWTSAKTAQAPPADLRPLQADKAPDGKSMRIFWDEPARPNGVITLYRLFKDGVQVYSGTAREYTVGKLVPFTPYDFQLEACTSAGCTKGAVQVVYSAQIPPDGQAPPLQGFVNESSVEVRWKPPAVNNGVLQRFDVIRRASPGGGSGRRRRALTPEQVIYSTSDTNKTDYSYVDSGLAPYTRYQYKVRTVNSGGAADSDWLEVLTAQAAPTGLNAPIIVQHSARRLNVTWRAPDSPNGVISVYFVNRNGSVKHQGHELSFVDQPLEPYTVYSYTVTCCTGGGCTTSPAANQRTPEASPELVQAPVLEALSALAVRISWGEPGKPNGVITRYALFEAGNSQSLYTGLATSTSVSGKQPFTQYSFHISACTSVGCTAGAEATIRTLEASPQDLARPVATVAGSHLVRVTWSAPARPNGVILYYLLARNGSQAYNGTDTRHEDNTVAPYTTYGYTVTAVNSAGHVTSSVGVSAATHPGIPDGVAKPVLQVLSSSSIHVSWDAPAKPNGVITAYKVVHVASQDVQVTSDAGTGRAFTLQGLEPYTAYEIWIRACTAQGCSSGESAKARTRETAPAGQSPPDFPTNQIAARSVQVAWQEPRQPNGFISAYELQRRRANELAQQSVYNTTNGTRLEYRDASVKPYTTYEYRVLSANSAGRTASAWAQVKTPSAAPEGLEPPRVLERFMDKLDVQITAPRVPNGEVRSYTLEASDGAASRWNVSWGLDLRRELTGLRPFRAYALRVFACTDGGCAGSDPVSERTTEAPPEGFAAPEVTFFSSRSVGLEWAPPVEPNGDITRYDVLYKAACGKSCPVRNISDVGLRGNYTVIGLLPYVTYEFQIRAHNRLYSGLSVKKSVTTKAEDPKPTGAQPRVNVSGFHVSVDWSACFTLNGPLDQYELLENGVVAYTGAGVRANRPNRDLGEYTYSVSATTIVNGQRRTAKAPTVTVRVTGEDGPSPTSAPRVSESPFYESIWFIVVVVLVALLLLFVLVAVCMCRRTGDRTVYVRERDPLPPRTKLRSRPPSSTSLYSASDPKAGSFIDLQPMPPYHSSTTALFDSSEATHRRDNTYSRSPHSGSLPRKGPMVDEFDVDYGYSNRDSGLYDDEKLGLSDSDESLPYPSFRKEQYFTDTHL